jgi:hypothetical protein
VDPGLRVHDIRGRVIDRRLGCGRVRTGRKEENGTSYPGRTDDRESDRGATHQSDLGK